MSLPAHVTLCEVGPRDGFQFEPTPISTDLKLEVINALVDAGLKEIQVTSFVHPKWVPQMADAEEVCSRLPVKHGVIYTGLALNRRGLERAYRVGLKHVDLSIATHPQHSKDNANMTVEEGMVQMLDMIDLCHTYGIEARAGLQTVFGYQAPGDLLLNQILDMSRQIVAAGVESLSLADSTGMANPVMIKERVQAVQAVAGETPLVMHLHDTRGLGMANVVAALECGVHRFDTSLGGMGGCPFIPGATGNISTEDTAYLLASMGIETGVDLAKVAVVSQRMEQFLGKRLSGKMHRLIEVPV